MNNDTTGNYGTNERRDEKRKRRNELTTDGEQTKEEPSRIRRKFNGDEKTDRERIWRRMWR